MLEEQELNDDGGMVYADPLNIQQTTDELPAEVLDAKQLIEYYQTHDEELIQTPLYKKRFFGLLIAILILASLYVSFYFLSEPTEITLGVDRRLLVLALLVYCSPCIIVCWIRYRGHTRDVVCGKARLKPVKEAYEEAIKKVNNEEEGKTKITVGFCCISGNRIEFYSRFRRVTKTPRRGIGYGC